MSSPQPKNNWPGGSDEETPGQEQVANFDDVFENLSRASSLVFTPGVIVYYVVQMAVGTGGYIALIAAMVATMRAMNADGAAPLDSMANVPDSLQWVILGVIFGYATCWYALGVGPLAAIREAARGDGEAVSSIGRTFSISLRAGIKTVPGLILFSLLVVLGFLVLIIPGFVMLYLLAPMLYLVVTGQASTPGSVTKSFEWADNHSGAVGAMYVAMFGGMILTVVAGVVVGPLLSMLLQVAMSVFYLVVYTAAMLTIDMAENDWRYGKAHDGIEQIFE